MGLNSAHDGYTYQDLLISYFILNDILDGNRKSIYSIDKKHTVGRYVSVEKDKSGKFKEKSVPDRFDDFVIFNESFTKRMQIKYSNEDNNRNFIKSDFANDKKGLGLYELYRTWLELKNNTEEFRLCLAWNKPIDVDIISVLKSTREKSSFNSFITTRYKIDIDKLWEFNSLPSSNWVNLRKFINDYNINREDFSNFCDDLIIELEFPKASLDFDYPNNLEKILIEQANKLGIGFYPNENRTINDFLNTLAYTINKLKGNKINVNVLLQKLEVITDFGSIEQKFEIDESKNIKSNNIFKSFYEELVSNRSMLLIGDPGSGKSWFLTNFINYLMTNSKYVIRHYCHTSVEDELADKRIESDVFFGNLISDLLNRIPSLQKYKNNYISNLGELNFLLSHVRDELIIVIDGLDHIDRILKKSKQLSLEKTRIIDFISRINLPNNIFIVLGTQRITEIEVLKESYGFSEYIIPKWDKDDTEKLMKKYSLENETVNSKLLSEKILEKSEGNVLYTTYILKVLCNKTVNSSIIDDFPSHKFNLSGYYDYLTNQIQDNNTSEVLSCLEFSVNIQELKELVYYKGHLENNLKILSPLISENNSRGGIRLYHDSFRRFNMEKLESSDHLNTIYLDIAKWLENKGFYKFTKSYHYLFKYYIKSKKFNKVKKYAKIDFLSKSLLNGYSKELIKNNYDKFSYIASQTKDWSLFIFISELNRTINSSLSENYDEFLQNFKKYFNLIISLYGTQKAYDMLFFEGKKVFNDEDTAKAFYYLYKNGMSLDWRILKVFLKNNARLDTYKYRICLLLNTNKFDSWIKVKKYFLVQEKHFNYLKIVIEELYYKFGISKVIDFIDSVEVNDKDELLYRINNILENIASTELLLVHKKSSKMRSNLNYKIFYEGKYIKKLKNINSSKLFLVYRKPSKMPCKLNYEIFYEGKYINKNELNTFLNLLEEHANYNIEELKKLSNSLDTYDFSLAWLKFTINVYILESELSLGNMHKDDEFEEQLLNNFRMLKCFTNCTNLHHEHRSIIQKSIFRMLKYIKNSWNEVIEIINFLKDSSYKLEYFFYIGMLNDYESNENRKYLIREYESILDENLKKSDGYSFLIESSFSLALLYSHNGEDKKAKNLFKKGISYITAYTFRKDTTLYEIINPLSAISDINKIKTEKYIKELLALNLTIESNSENGKGIRWLYIGWFDQLLLVDRTKAICFLTNKLLEDEYYWKHEHMFTNFVTSVKNINPIVLLFLHKVSNKEADENYIKSFANSIYLIKDIDKELSKQSLIYLLNMNSLIENIKIKNNLNVLKNNLNVSKAINFKEKERNCYSIFTNTLINNINEQFNIDELSSCLTIEQLIKYFNKKEKITNRELLFLRIYINEIKKDDVERLLTSIIQKRLVGVKKYYENLRELVLGFNCKKKIKVLLLIKIFVYSQDEWFENFINKQSFCDAIRINKEQSLKYLSKELHQKFSKIYYNSQSTSNLIIAFKEANIESEQIMNMYKQGFSFIKSRVLNIKEVHNKVFECSYLQYMSIDEQSIVLLLVKLKNYSKSNQEDILYALNYLISYNNNLLIKPLKWFFNNLEYFSQLSVSGVLEILIININIHSAFLKILRNDIMNIRDIENMYLQNNLNLLLKELENV